MMEFSILLGRSLVCVFGLILKWDPAGCASSFLRQVLLFSVIGNSFRKQTNQNETKKSPKIHK